MKRRIMVLILAVFVLGMMRDQPGKRTGGDGADQEKDTSPSGTGWGVSESSSPTSGGAWTSGAGSSSSSSSSDGGGGGGGGGGGSIATDTCKELGLSCGEWLDCDYAYEYGKQCRYTDGYTLEDGKKKGVYVCRFKNSHPESEQRQTNPRCWK